MSLFFENPLIQILWTQNFKNSREFVKFFREMEIYGEEGMKKFKEYYKKVEN